MKWSADFHKFIGKRVAYLKTEDLDAGYRHLSYRLGTVTDIYRKHLVIDGDYIHASQLYSIEERK